jgi:hypothetical protein
MITGYVVAAATASAATAAIASATTLDIQNGYKAFAAAA